jgi:hypothetical protein
MGAGGVVLKGTGDWLDRAMSSVSVSAGIPRPASTARRADAPPLSETGQVGNPHPGANAATPPAPAQPMLQISYPTPAGRKVMELPWRPGLRVRHYLREYSMIALWLRCKSVDRRTRRKVRLQEIPYPGQVIFLQRVNAGVVI